MDRASIERVRRRRTARGAKAHSDGRAAHRQAGDGQVVAPTHGSEPPLESGSTLCTTSTYFRTLQADCTPAPPNDIERRLAEHQEGLSRWTRSRGPWQLVHQGPLPTRSDAIRRERQLKVGAGPCGSTAGRLCTRRTEDQRRAPGGQRDRRLCRPVAGTARTAGGSSLRSGPSPRPRT
ncbi:MAG: GIY-YIG nuclease family protein [Dehalococcoidia bacterium]